MSRTKFIWGKGGSERLEGEHTDSLPPMPPHSAAPDSVVEGRTSEQQPTDGQMIRQQPRQAGRRAAHTAMRCPSYSPWGSGAELAYAPSVAFQRVTVLAVCWGVCPAWHFTMWSECPFHLSKCHSLNHSACSHYLQENTILCTTVTSWQI